MLLFLKVSQDLLDFSSIKLDVHRGIDVKVIEYLSQKLLELVCHFHKGYN